MGDDSASPEDTTGAEECQLNTVKGPIRDDRGGPYFRGAGRGQNSAGQGGAGQR